MFVAVSARPDFRRIPEYRYLKYRPLYELVDQLSASARPPKTREVRNLRPNRICKRELATPPRARGDRTDAKTRYQKRQTQTPKSRAGRLAQMRSYIVKGGSAMESVDSALRDPGVKSLRMSCKSDGEAASGNTGGKSAFRQDWRRARFGSHAR